MTGTMEQMTMSDGATISVYHAQPAGERRGGVIVVQEIFGVTEHIRDVADEYAADGYEVLAPALFDREHPGFEAEYGGEGLARGLELARQLHPFDLSLKDVQTCVDALGNAGPVFVVGYCYGGSVAWLAATRMTGVAAASGYYGGQIPDTADEEPKVPVALHFGRFDTGIPMEGVEKVEAKQWPNAAVYLYEAGHGFNSDRRKDYHEPSADLAKERTLALFRANGDDGRHGFDRKRRDVATVPHGYIGGMTQQATLDTDAAWAAFDARDRNADGRFVVAVRTTRIYCKPSCPARHPRRENVSFYEVAADARDAGYRACLRCKPDEVGRDRIAVARATALIEASEDIVSLEALAEQVGYAPHHFHRLFKRATGVTPAAYARGLRAAHAADALTSENKVTNAIYEAGYSAPSRFYEGGAKRLGMTPSAWARGGAGVTIRWTVVDTSLGALFVAATDKGLCRVSFDEDEDALHARFPNADIELGGAALADLAARVVAAVESPERDHNLPLDVRGTAFQEAVWQALRDIPLGETRTYAELAAIAGNPKAVRAAGSACGANQVAVVIPCHRAQRTDGTLGGYAFGLERKRALLAREGVD